MWLAGKYGATKGTLKSRTVTSVICQFYMMDRASDHEVVRLKDCTLVEAGKMQVVVQKGKTDQRGKGIAKYLEDGPQPHNAYQWLLGLLEAAQAAGCDGYWVVFSSRTVINRFIKEEMRLLHPEFTGRYSTHSMRRGGATAAHKAGMTDSVIQRTGGWKSERYQVYIDDDGAEGCWWTGQV